MKYWIGFSDLSSTWLADSVNAGAYARRGLVGGLHDRAEHRVDQAGLGLVGDRVADDDVIAVLQHSRVVVALAHVGERGALGACMADCQHLGEAGIGLTRRVSSWTCPTVTTLIFGADVFL